MARPSTAFLAVLLFAAVLGNAFAYDSKASCSTKTLSWVQSGHNEECSAVCKRNGSRKPFSSSGSQLCAQFDPVDPASPLDTDWVAGSFEDIAKDPENAQKQCFIHRKYVEDPTDLDMADQPIESSSDFYCGCWKDTTACKKWKPKWVLHAAANNNTADMATCSDVCIGAGLVVVDRKPLSYNYICRPTALKSSFGWEHYEGDSAMNMCHYVQYDPNETQSYNAKNESYECLCQKKP